MNSIITIIKGIAAGFVATSVLSVLMLTKQWLPQLDSITVMDSIARDMAMAAGLPTPFAGWLWHFVVGSLIWGWMYAVMEPILPGRQPWRKGLYFGLTASLLVWLIVLPLAGAGRFGMHLSSAQPIVSLAQHLVYGLVLAVVYDWLVRFLATSHRHQARGYPSVGQAKDTESLISTERNKESPSPLLE